MADGKVCWWPEEAPPPPVMHTCHSTWANKSNYTVLLLEKSHWRVSKRLQWVLKSIRMKRMGPNYKMRLCGSFLCLAEFRNTSREKQCLEGLTLGASSWTAFPTLLLLFPWIQKQARWQLCFQTEKIFCALPLCFFFHTSFCIGPGNVVGIAIYHPIFSSSCMHYSTTVRYCKSGGGGRGKRLLQGPLWRWLR